MNREKKIKEEVEKSMNQLDNFKRVESNPYFYTRFQAKLKSTDEREYTSVWDVISSKILRPVLLTLIILANIISVVVAFDTKQQVESQDTYITAFAEEYSLNQDDTSLFNFND